MQPVINAVPIITPIIIPSIEESNNEFSNNNIELMPPSIKNSNTNSATKSFSKNIGVGNNKSFEISDLLYGFTDILLIIIASGTISDPTSNTNIICDIPKVNIKSPIPSTRAIIIIKSISVITPKAIPKTIPNVTPNATLKSKKSFIEVEKEGEFNKVKTR